MSEKIQRSARTRRDNARQRQQAALDRADRNHDRGEELLARSHEASAAAQGIAADAANGLLRADRAVEGDQLGDGPEDHG